MTEFIPVVMGLYVIMNFVLAIVLFTEALHDNFSIFDLRIKHLILLVLFPVGAIVGVLLTSLVHVMDTLVYMVKKNERIQRVANTRIFKDKGDT